MRIVGFKEFMSLPEGTVFAKYSPCVFDDTCIKMGNCGEHDFFYSDLSTGFETCSTDHMFDLAEEMEADPNFTSPLCFSSQMRDGLFDEEQLFAVWSKSDITTMIARLAECL